MSHGVTGQADGSDSERSSFVNPTENREKYSQILQLMRNKTFTILILSRKTKCLVNQYFDGVINQMMYFNSFEKDGFSYFLKNNLFPMHWNKIRLVWRNSKKVLVMNDYRAVAYFLFEFLNFCNFGCDWYFIFNFFFNLFAWKR